MNSYGLSKRLEAVTSFVPQGARLLDVGSDHAYLPVALLRAGHIVSAVAGEVVQGPFQSACSTVAEAGFSEQIAVRLANGLEALQETDHIDTITICGMGGRLIADILQAGKEKLDSVERLILQPNNREDELRQWIMENSLVITDEAIVAENGKIYEIMVVEKGQQTLSAQELRFGPFLSREKSPIFVQKWQKEQEKISQALANIPAQHGLERSALSKKITAIEEVLGHES